MLRSDVFVDFLKLVQLVSLLFLTKVIISLQNMSPCVLFWSSVLQSLDSGKIHSFGVTGKWFLFCCFGSLDSRWKIKCVT